MYLDYILENGKYGINPKLSSNMGTTLKIVKKRYSKTYLSMESMFSEWYAWNGLKMGGNILKLVLEYKEYGKSGWISKVSKMY